MEFPTFYVANSEGPACYTDCHNRLWPETDHFNVGKIVQTDTLQNIHFAFTVFWIALLFEISRPNDANNKHTLTLLQNKLRKYRIQSRRNNAETTHQHHLPDLFSQTPNAMTQP